MKVNLSLELLKRTSCPLLIKVHTSLDFPWLSQKPDAARNCASCWSGIILSWTQGTVKYWTRKLRLQARFIAVKLIPEKRREGFCPSDFLMPPIFSQYSLPSPPSRFCHSGLKRHSVVARLGCKTESKKFYLHHFTCKQCNVGMLCIVGAPGHSTEFISQELQGIHLKNERHRNKTSYPGWSIWQWFFFWVGRNVLPLTVLLTMNEEPDKNHHVK